MAEDTPMMKQYRLIKEHHRDCLLFFRLGDFYEMFDEDARTASRELDLTLTTRDRGKAQEDQVPMCGVPYHSVDAYLGRLIARGYKVAICEQMEDPALAKGLVDRDVIRIVTPGTVTESNILDSGSSNYLSAICADGMGFGVCFADISTGEMCVRPFGPGEEDGVIGELGRFSPAEIVIDHGAAENKRLMESVERLFKCMVESREDLFEKDRCVELILGQFKVRSTDELKLGRDERLLRASGALLGYIAETQKRPLEHINRLEVYNDGRYMELDIQTIRNLELLANARTGEKRGSLLWVLDKTKTPMGSRLLRSWVTRPLLNYTEIVQRQSAVEELWRDGVKRPELILALRSVGDMERIIGKAVYGTANCRDMAFLASSIGKLPAIVDLLDGAGCAVLSKIRDMDTLDDLKARIDATVCDEPPISVRDGGMIRDGFDPEVDRLRALLHGSEAALTDIEVREKQRTGKKLKVGYNKVFGYYIEIPRSQSSDVPEDYIRKQTLVNCERFVTQELKELEVELTGAGEKLCDLEYRIYTQLREFLAANVTRVQATAASVARLDVLCAFAQCAADYNWCRPNMVPGDAIDITDGRHPVVELTQKDTLFVPNDTHLNCRDAQIAVITGPNMAGKSTYMRQTALIALMAQMGSFVPARSADMSIVDRVFTRIGASDDLSGGMSTFMVEMSEVAAILRSATSRSLIILDEVGRGTSTYDGMAVARAVVEYCANRRKLGAKTMFATHYHELTALEGQIEGVKNYNISAKKRGDDIIFLRKIVPGGTDDSYGIEVAKLAGVPDPVIKRARVILAELTEDRPSAGAPAAPAGGDSGQMSLEGLAGEEICAILRGLDLNTMTPLEALSMLFDFKRRVTQ